MSNDKHMMMLRTSDFLVGALHNYRHDYNYQLLSKILMYYISVSCRIQLYNDTCHLYIYIWVAREKKLKIKN